MIRQFFKKKKQASTERADAPQRIDRKDHGLSRKAISSNALKVLHRLNKAGFDACLVGGGVRDCLLDLRPKDYDVATSAHPHEVRKIFKNSRIIGRRFQIVHVYFPREIIEVSTYRAPIEEHPRHQPGAMTRQDNHFGTIEEDAWRRDFTVNAMYYDISDQSIIDYTSGLKDLDSRLIRMIGDPVQRYHEDPVRLLRAIRLSSKLGFDIEAATKKPLIELSHLLSHVSPSRLFDELLKLFFAGHAEKTYQALCDYDYFRVFFPRTQAILDKPENQHYRDLVSMSLRRTDERVANNKSLNPAFLLSVLLWPAVETEFESIRHEKKNFNEALSKAVSMVLFDQLSIVKIPKRYTVMIRVIYMMQFQLLEPRPRRVFTQIAQRYFRAAFDFIALRSDSGAPIEKTVEWWVEFQKAGSKRKKEMAEALPKKPKRRRNKKK